MKTIYKYDLTGRHITEIDLPGDAVVVNVAMQGDAMCMWVLHDTEAPKIKRTFIVIGTGWEIDTNERYVGTIHTPPFVWHIMEVV